MGCRIVFLYNSHRVIEMCLKETNLKKAVFRTLVLLIICFAYTYQITDYTTGKSVDYAALFLQSHQKN